MCMCMSAVGRNSLPSWECQHFRKTNRRCYHKIRKSMINLLLIRRPYEFGCQSFYSGNESPTFNAKPTNWNMNRKPKQQCNEWIPIISVNSIFECLLILWHHHQDTFLPSPVIVSFILAAHTHTHPLILFHSTNFQNENILKYIHKINGYIWLRVIFQIEALIRWVWGEIGFWKWKVKHNLIPAHFRTVGRFFVHDIQWIFRDWWN